MGGPRLSFRARLSLVVTLLLVATIAVATLIAVIVGTREIAHRMERSGRTSTFLANRTIQNALSMPDRGIKLVKGQMVLSALLTSELTELAQTQAPVSSETISKSLKRVLQLSATYQSCVTVNSFTVTDETGNVLIDTGIVDPAAFPEIVLDDKPTVEELKTEVPGSDLMLVVDPSARAGQRNVRVGVGKQLVNMLKAEFPVQQVVDGFMSDPIFARILVVHNSGDVLAKAGKPFKVEEGIHDQETVEFCKTFLSVQNSENVSIRPFGQDIGIVTRLTAPPDIGPCALFIQYHSGEVLADFKKYLMISLASCVIMIVISVIVCLRLCRGLYRPIGTLTKGVRAFAHGDFSTRVPAKHDDEIGELAFAFNNMADSLSSYLQQLEEETQRRERLESEFRIAGEVQRSLLPAMPPVIPGLELLGFCMPAREVGGDFYDYIELDNERLFLVLGDATGKGLSAALLATECNSVLRSLAPQVQSPAELLFRTNNALQKRIGPTCRFITLFCALVDLKHGFLKYASAGHNPPLLLEPNTGTCRRLLSTEGLPLGLVEDTNYSETDLRLDAQATLFIYSDGVSEAHSGDGVLYGEDRLHQILGKIVTQSVTDIVTSVCEDLKLHMQDHEIVDDMTIVCLRYKARDAVAAQAEKRRQREGWLPTFDEAPI